MEPGWDQESQVTILLFFSCSDFWVGWVVGWFGLWLRVGLCLFRYCGCYVSISGFVSLGLWVGGFLVLYGFSTCCPLCLLGCLGFGVVLFIPLVCLRGCLVKLWESFYELVGVSCLCPVVLSFCVC